MTNAMSQIIRISHPNLGTLTPARVSLPTTGNSIATNEVLNFQLAHAQARDAVHAELHLPSFAQRLIGELPILNEASIPVVQLRSNAPDRAAYLRNPNLGRTLHPDSVSMLCPNPCDLAITIADGLSALAIERNAVPVLAYLLPQLLADAWSLAPLTLVQQGRVAVGDAIGSLLAAKCSLILIGERPGLSSADSMGAYITWTPHADRTDADRNCLSNIRSAGLAPDLAAERLLRYLKLAQATQRTGTSLKEGSSQLNLASRSVNG
ncbi:MAG: ethanolamine ammonia-lyase subunit EutC [Terracidiphilus sp.]